MQTCSSPVAPKELEVAYHDIARDREREQEALDWPEGLIVDSSPAVPMLRGEVWWVNKRRGPEPRPGRSNYAQW